MNDLMLDPSDERKKMPLEGNGINLKVYRQLLKFFGRLSSHVPHVDLIVVRRT